MHVSETTRFDWSVQQSDLSAMQHMHTPWRVLSLILEGKLLLITNRKSHMGFQSIPKSVTLNDHERRNGRVVCIISLNLLAFGTYWSEM